MRWVIKEPKINPRGRSEKIVASIEISDRSRNNYTSLIESSFWITKLAYLSESDCFETWGTDDKKG
jgi:hypothetical protein